MHKRMRSTYGEYNRFEIDSSKRRNPLQPPNFLIFWIKDPHLIVNYYFSMASFSISTDVLCPWDYFPLDLSGEV